jgi:GntR family transcriptional repressor for pyruvate dehydrogenase complex
MERMTGLLGRSPRSKRSDQIAEDLKRWIAMTGKKPGDRLPQERELITLFSSSRGTVREALKSLEVQGLVEVVSGPNGGARLVRVPEDRSMQLLTNYFYFQDISAADIYELRRAIEPLVVRAVIDVLTPEDFAGLRQTIDICRKGVEGKLDIATHRIAELRFHQILADRVPNPILRFYALFLIHLVFSFVTPKSVAQGQHETFSSHVIASHEALLQALEKRQAEKAAKLMGSHMHDAACLVGDMESAFDRTLVDSLQSAGSGWEQTLARVAASLEEA